MRILIVVAMTCIGMGLAHQVGQPESELKGGGARFEVVSIKPCPNAFLGGGSTPIRASPGRLDLECFTVDELIRLAYIVYPGGKRNDAKVPNVLPHEAKAPMKGGPSWIRSRRFSINAKAEKPSTVEEMSGPMMQHVLKERFKLRIREQTQALAVYDLAQRQGGAKLQLAKDGGCFELDLAKSSPPPRASAGRAPLPICGGFRVSAAGGVDTYGVTMRNLCLLLSRALDKDVIDKTGLTGVYDLHLETTLAELSPFKVRDNSAPEPLDLAVPQAMDPGGSIFTALRKLGLQLKPGTRLARLIVIDHVEMTDGN